MFRRFFLIWLCVVVLLLFIHFVLFINMFFLLVLCVIFFPVLYQLSVHLRSNLDSFPVEQFSVLFSSEQNVVTGSLSKKGFRRVIGLLIVLFGLSLGMFFFQGIPFWFSIVFSVAFFVFLGLGVSILFFFSGVFHRFAAKRHLGVIRVYKEGVLRSQYFFPVGDIKEIRPSQAGSALTGVASMFLALARMGAPLRDGKEDFLLVLTNGEKYLLRVNSSLARPFMDAYSSMLSQRS